MLEEVIYEAYAPGRGYFNTISTDNKNRTVPNVRPCYRRLGAAWPSVPSIICSKKAYCCSIMIAHRTSGGIGHRSGADDVDVQDDGAVEVITTPDDFEAVSALMPPM